MCFRVLTPGTHSPVGITLKIHNGYSNTPHAKDNSQSTWTGRLIWDPKKESDFLANFKSDASQRCVCVQWR